MSIRDMIANRLKKSGGTGILAEKKAAKRVSGNLKPASGALPGAKGDFELPEFLVECKSTENVSMSIKLSWLHKIMREACIVGKSPALEVMFVTANGTPRQSGDWVMIPAQLWKETFLDSSQ